MLEPLADAAEIVPSLPTVGLNGRLFRFGPEAVRGASHLNHGLHKYPAKFIPQIPQWAMGYIGLAPGALLLDPFAGSGTTLVEGMTHGLRVAGADISPLARLITKAKCGLWTQPVQRTLSQVADLELCVRSGDSAGVIERNQRSLHKTWNFWFPTESMQRLLLIREAIESAELGSTDAERESLRAFLLVALSETAKRVSFLDERQIKVRFHAEKFANGVPDALDVFCSWVRKFVPRQYEFSHIATSAGGTFEALDTDARQLSLPQASVDAVVCSPPYINAIDYTMAHKYNLFLLNLVAPEHFKVHCREYIGVTERAVTTSMIAKTPRVGHAWTDAFVSELADGTSVDKNRAYIVSTYFNDMRASFQETRRVMRDESLFIIALGNSNKIRGRIVPTADILGDLATECGFELVEQFFHGVARRRIKFNRNTTAGIINNEAVLILKAV